MGHQKNDHLFMSVLTSFPDPLVTHESKSSQKSCTTMETLETSQESGPPFWIFSGPCLRPGSESAQNTAQTMADPQTSGPVPECPILPT